MDQTQFTTLRADFAAHAAHIAGMAVILSADADECLDPSVDDVVAAIKAAVSANNIVLAMMARGHK